MRSLHESFVKCGEKVSNVHNPAITELFNLYKLTLVQIVHAHQVAFLHAERGMSRDH